MNSFIRCEQHAISREANQLMPSGRRIFAGGFAILGKTDMLGL